VELMVARAAEQQKVLAASDSVMRILGIPHTDMLDQHLEVSHSRTLASLGAVVIHTRPPPGGVVIPRCSPASIAFWN
jgi:hypothetical protein